MRDWSSERGSGRLGLLVAVVVVCAVFFTGAKVIPVRINAYEFRDFVRDQARFASNTENADIRKLIVEKATELGIPLDKKNVRVTRTSKEIQITAKFEQPIDLKVTTYVYRFDTEERAPLF